MLPGLLQRVAAIPELEATREDAAQLLLATAFNFPAVLLTAGKQQWPQLQPVHSALLQCRDAAVRRTLACSLHEVAALLGPDQAMSDLSPAIQVIHNIGHAYLKVADAPSHLCCDGNYML